MFLRFTVAAALLTVASVSSAGPAEPPPNGGCLCPSGAEQLLEQIDHVFIGDILAVKGWPASGAWPSATIRVKEAFKGRVEGGRRGRERRRLCSWSVFEMAEPGRYIVFANRDDEDWLVTPDFSPADPAARRLAGQPGAVPRLRQGAPASPKQLLLRPPPPSTARLRLTAPLGAARPAFRPRTAPMVVTWEAWARPQPSGERDIARPTLAREVGYVIKPHAGRLGGPASPTATTWGCRTSASRRCTRLFNERGRGCERCSCRRNRHSRT